MDKTRTPFRNLAIGAVFEFASTEDFPFSGFERGPWTKTGPRTYEKVGPRAMECRVGTINVETISIVKE